MMIKSTITLVCAVAVTMVASSNTAQQAIKIGFAADTAGAEPKSFVPVVGVWRVDTERSKNVLAVDGRQWKEGQTASGIADKAKALYGERYAEFLDRVQAFAYYLEHTLTTRVWTEHSPAANQFTFQPVK